MVIEKRNRTVIQPCIVYSLPPPTKNPIIFQAKQRVIQFKTKELHIRYGQLARTITLQQPQRNLPASAGCGNSCRLFATLPRLLTHCHRIDSENHPSPQLIQHRGSLHESESQVENVTVQVH